MFPFLNLLDGHACASAYQAFPFAKTFFFFAKYVNFIKNEKVYKYKKVKRGNLPLTKKEKTENDYK